MTSINRCARFATLPVLCALFGLSLLAQEPGQEQKPPKPTDSVPTTAEPAIEPEHAATEPAILNKDRILGVLPNYRTVDASQGFHRLTTKQKFTIAYKDSFDWPIFATTAYFAGLSHLQGTDNATYGQGPKGYAYRYVVNYADQVVGNYFPEAIVPTIFHSDPRYIRKGEGKIATRVIWAVSRIFICKNDNGNPMFNVNEFVGNAMASVAVSSYHPHQRTLGDMVTQTGNYIQTDMTGQILKEFWPDLRRVYDRWRHK